jgi:hypothetical protein
MAFSRASSQPFPALGRPEMVGNLPLGKINSQSGTNAGLWSHAFGNTVRSGNSLFAYTDRSVVTGADVNIAKSEQMGSTIMVRTMTEANFYTGVLAPFFLTDKDRVDFNVTTFNATLATETPHFSVGRLVSSSRDQKTAVTIRKAIAYQMDVEFMSSEEGHAYHMAHLLQLANCALETCKADVAFKLIAAHDFERTEIVKRGLLRDMSPEAYMRAQAANFGRLQKNTWSINKLDSEMDFRLERIFGRADTWIIPSEITRYFSEAKEEYLRFDSAGPAGAAVIRDGPLPYGRFKTNRVFVTRSFQTDQIPENPFQVEDEFGEFYPMRNPPPLRNMRYRSQLRSIQIYDYTTDSFKEIDIWTALKNANLFKAKDPLYLSEVGPYQSFLPSNYDNKDFFNDADGKPIKRFGELEPEYQNVEQILEIARTMRASIADGNQDFRLARGLALIEQLKTLSGGDFAELEKFLNDADNTKFLSHQIPMARLGHAVAPSFQRPAFEQSASTGFLKVPNNFKLNSLLPGLHSWHGLKFLAAHGGEAIKEERDAARDFVDAFTSISNRISGLFPDSELVQAENASLHWHYPSRETVLFENLFSESSPPIYVAVGGDVNLAETRPRIEELQNKSSVKVSFRSLDTPLQAHKALAIATIVRMTNAETPEQRTKLAKALNCKIGKEALVPDLENWGGETHDSVDAAIRDTVEKLAAEFSTVPIGESVNGLLSVIREMLHSNNSKTYVQTPFVASANLAAALYDQGSSSKLSVGDPFFHELVIDNERLEALTRHLPQRTRDVSAEDRVAAQKVAGELPAWTNKRTLVNSAIYVNKLNTSLGSSFAEHEIEQGRTDSLHSALLSSRAQMIRGIVAPSLPQLKDVARNIGAVAAPDKANPAAGGNIRLAENYKAIFENGSVDELTKHLALAYLFAPISEESVKAMVDADMRVPFDCIVTRPHITFHTLCAVKMLADGETMRTMVSKVTFEMANDPKTHSHVGSLVWRSCAFVAHPENIGVARSIFVNGVRQGLRMGFIDPKAYNPTQGTFDDQSIIVIAISQNEQIDGNLFSLNGTLHVPEFGHLSLTKDPLRPQYSTAARYNRLYGWNEQIHGQDLSRIPQSLQQDRSRNNTLCMPGAFISYDFTTGSPTVFNTGRGHLAGLVYPGCAKVLDGYSEEVNQNPWVGYRIV